MPANPPTAAQLNPAAIGERAAVVVLYIAARPGDSIELLGAEAIGAIDGASIRFLVSRPILSHNGDHVTGEVFEPLEGALISMDVGAGASGVAVGSVIPGQPVGVAIELIPALPGRYRIDSVRLRYRLNGGPEQVGEGIDIVWTVCADDPRPTDCPEQ